MKHRVLLAATAIASLGVFTVHAQAADAGKTMYDNVCKNCHGPTAKGMASFPGLAGNSADYLSERLTQYREGEKVGANSPLMWPLAADLTDEDIHNLASYIATAFD